MTAPRVEFDREEDGRFIVHVSGVGTSTVVYGETLTDAVLAAVRVLMDFARGKAFSEAAQIVSVRAGCAADISAQCRKVNSHKADWWAKAQDELAVMSASLRAKAGEDFP